MNNQTRRELLNRHRQSGFPGSIMDVFSAYDAGRDIISEFVQEQQGQQQLQQMQQMQQMQQQQPQPIVANTPEEQEQGLRPFHERGQVDQSMVFPNIPANAPFNTVGMKAPINIDKYDNNGHLIESFKSVPPGIQNLPTGPQEGTVVETPANMQTGGAKPANRFTSLAIAQDMAKRFGGDPRTYLALSDTVAFHESFHTMNPKMEQITDSGEPGPGKGAFQIEGESMETYRNRAENYAKGLGVAPPQWAMNASNDARELTMDQQRALFLMNMAENSRTSMGNYQQGKTTTTEQWLRGWKGIEKPGDRQAFRTSTQLAREKGIPNSSVEEYNQMLRNKAKAAIPLPPTELMRMLAPSRNK